MGWPKGLVGQGLVSWSLNIQMRIDRDALSVEGWEKIYNIKFERFWGKPQIGAGRDFRALQLGFSFLANWD
jgi:hypothetical protein